MLKLKNVITLFLLAFSSCLYAETVPPAAFAKDINYASAKISPDGTKMAVAVLSKGKRRLAVFDMATFKVIGGADLGEGAEIGNYYWANNERIVSEIWERYGWKEQADNFGELFAVNYDGSKAEIIYGYRAGEEQIGSRMKKRESVRGWANIINMLPNDDEHILISSTPMSDDSGKLATVHKLNVYTGKLSRDRVLAPVPLSRFIADREGNLKFAAGLDKDYENRAFRFENDEWVEITNNFGSEFSPLALTKKGDALYYFDTHESGKQGLYSFDLTSGESKLIYVDEKVSITDINFNADRSAVYALLVDDGYPTYVMLNDDSDEAKLFRSFMATFPGYEISITSRSRDRSKWLLYVNNDIDAGSYYLYDKSQNRLAQLFANFDHIDINLMAQTTPIEFKSFDDTTVAGYITYPVNHKPGMKVPLVTVVHGGPHGIRDYWNFVPQVQMLAAQGYAVLRVNYRGSGGYGEAFETAGYHEWGNGIQRDIIAGTEWAIAQGSIDSNKVCIMGGSFGGYSAVMSSVLAPDLFKCSVANVGVYDLQLMYDEGDIPKRFFGKDYLDKAIGSDPEVLRDFSPITHIAKLKAEVLIAHGEKDERVPFTHAKRLREALEQHGKSFEWFVKSSEGHGFYDEENRTEYYERVAAFLAKHLK